MLFLQGFKVEDDPNLLYRDRSLRYQTLMTLIEAQNKIHYEIDSISLESLDDSTISRLLHFGFVEGEKVELITKVPLFKEPLLVSIRGSQIALTKRQAGIIRLRN
jgi:Fe2+ transport system protein FeoA